MVTIVSSLTGRALFTLDIDEGVVTLRPEAVRVALVSLQESGLSDHVVIRSQPNSARIPVSRILHGAVLHDSRVVADVGCPNLMKNGGEMKTDIAHYVDEQKGINDE